MFVVLCVIVFDIVAAVHYTVVVKVCKRFVYSERSVAYVFLPCVAVTVLFCTTEQQGPGRCAS